MLESHLRGEGMKRFSGCVQAIRFTALSATTSPSSIRLWSNVVWMVGYLTSCTRWARVAFLLRMSSFADFMSQEVASGLMVLTLSMMIRRESMASLSNICGMRNSVLEIEKRWATESAMRVSCFVNVLRNISRIPGALDCVFRAGSSAGKCCSVVSGSHHLICWRNLQRKIGAAIVCSTLAPSCSVDVRILCTPANRFPVTARARHRGSAPWIVTCVVSHRHYHWTKASMVTPPHLWLLSLHGITSWLLTTPLSSNYHTLRVL